MKIKDLKIGTQLNLAFGVVLFFVVVLGAISYIATDDLQLQMENMYEHPLKVRRAISELRKDVLAIQSGIRGLLITNDEHETEKYLNSIESEKENTKGELKILNEKFLGPKDYISKYKQEYDKWDLINDVNFRLIRAGKNKVVEDWKKNLDNEEAQQKEIGRAHV